MISMTNHVIQLSSNYQLSLHPHTEAQCCDFFHYIIYFHSVVPCGYQLTTLQFCVVFIWYIIYYNTIQIYIYIHNVHTFYIYISYHFLQIESRKVESRSRVEKPQMSQHQTLQIPERFHSPFTILSFECPAVVPLLACSSDVQAGNQACGAIPTGTSAG